MARPDGRREPGDEPGGWRIPLRRGDEYLHGFWVTPTPEQVVFMDMQGRQTSFTLVNGRLAGTDGDVYFSLTRPERPVVRPWLPLVNTGHVPGFDLVARSEALELYARADTGEVAIYDLRSGRTVWSNPQDADQDKQANRTTMNLCGGLTRTASERAGPSCPERWARSW